MMMMIGDNPRSNLTGQIPPWDPHYFDDQTAHIQSPISHDATHHYETALMALQRFLPSNNAEEDGGDEEDFDFPVDAFSCDNFRMFDFKVKKCVLARSHDWTACPFAHPGEKARRRDPRKYNYSGSACPDFRKGACRRGDTCEYAHGVFECWLHPARYRTQPCKDGTHCRRRVCFFAHTPEQLRVLPYSSTSPEASPGRYGQDPFGMFGSSPKFALYSPPPSPPAASSSPVFPSGAISARQLAGAMSRLHVNKMKLGPSLSGSPPSWGFGVVSPRSPAAIRPGIPSLPSTPIRAQSQNPRAPREDLREPWGTPPCEEETAMERVESGQELRERIYAKLRKENSLDRMGLPADSTLGSGHYTYGMVIS